MASEQEKAGAFVARLLANPALGNFNSLQKEEQIIQFLQVNAVQLHPTLASSHFFPNKNWNQILGLLLSELTKITDQKLFTHIQSFINEEINFSFITLLRQQHVSNEKTKESLVSFIKDLLKKQNARRAFTGAYSALYFNIIDRYLNEVFARKSYIHFELTKVQRLKLSKDDIRNFIMLTLLLKPSISLLNTGAAGTQQDRLGGLVQSQFAEKVFQALKKRLPLVPEQILHSSVDVNVSFLNNRFVEATSRFSAIFAARCRNYHPHIKVDRGADTPDKSWLNIARRNYKFNGFDIKMLDEFYQIAAENGW